MDKVILELTTDELWTIRQALGLSMGYYQMHLDAVDGQPNRATACALYDVLGKEHREAHDRISAIYDQAIQREGA